jgi:hypothetical protein
MARVRGHPCGGDGHGANREEQVKKAILGGTLSVSLALVVALVVLGATPALATPTTQDGQRLENLLQREQILLAKQQDRLAMANNVVAKTQEWVDVLKGEGKDVSALQSALADYQSAIAVAAPFLDTAKTTLDARAGFDAAGQVTDRSDALKTIVDAGKAERQFHLTITPAALTFRAAVLAFRQANK